MPKYGKTFLPELLMLLAELKALAWNSSTRGSRPEGNAELSEDTCEGCEVMQPPPRETTRNTAGSEESTGEMIWGPEELSCQIYVSGESSAICTEGLKECLNKPLEFCFSQENSSKELYLIAQMNSDQFVPIGQLPTWKRLKKKKLTIDPDLEVLRFLRRRARRWDQVLSVGLGFSGRFLKYHQ